MGPAPLIAGRSPFHQGERSVQERLGVRERVEALGQRFIRDHLPPEHRDFYAGLSTLLVGSLDPTARPRAALLVGTPGFISSPNPETLVINGGLAAGNPFHGAQVVGSRVGVLGIDLRTRRRNRLSGRIGATSNDVTTLTVEQTFGNCPQYIQAREAAPIPAADFATGTRFGAPQAALDACARELITGSDTFFVATAHPGTGGDPAHGVDISHRGGKPGFVRVDDDCTLTWPEFRGNSFFNTLGNIILNPATALLFLDFSNGTLLHLGGDAHIVWDDPVLATFAGAQRLVRFRVREARRVEHAVPLRWTFLDYSPNLAKLGSWPERRP